MEDSRRSRAEPTGTKPLAGFGKPSEWGTTISQVHGAEIMLVFAALFAVAVALGVFAGRVCIT